MGELPVWAEAAPDGPALAVGVGLEMAMDVGVSIGVALSVVDVGWACPGQYCPGSELSCIGRTHGVDIAVGVGLGEAVGVGDGDGAHGAGEAVGDGV